MRLFLQMYFIIIHVYQSYNLCFHTTQTNSNFASSVRIASCPSERFWQTTSPVHLLYRNDISTKYNYDKLSPTDKCRYKQQNIGNNDIVPCYLSRTLRKQQVCSVVFTPAFAQCSEQFPPLQVQMTRIDRCTSLERLNHSSKKLMRHGKISIRVSPDSAGRGRILCSQGWRHFTGCMTLQHQSAICQFKDVSPTTTFNYTIDFFWMPEFQIFYTSNSALLF